MSSHKRMQHVFRRNPLLIFSFSHRKKPKLMLTMETRLDFAKDQAVEQIYVTYAEPILQFMQRLNEQCTFCFVLDDERDWKGHSRETCPKLNNQVFFEAWRTFRSHGLDYPKGVCYFCSLPQVNSKIALSENRNSSLHSTHAFDTLRKQGMMLTAAFIHISSKPSSLSSFTTPAALPLNVRTFHRILTLYLGRPEPHNLCYGCKPRLLIQQMRSCATISRSSSGLLKDRMREASHYSKIVFYF